MLRERHLPGADGVRLHVTTTDADGPRALLVVHGGPDWDHSYLREPLVRLGGIRLVLPDLRGCGRSTQGLPDTAYTPDAVVRDLLALLDALGEERVDVLGFSYGGLVAQRLVVTAPERFRSLVVASSSVLPVPPDAYADRPDRAGLVRAEQEVWASSGLDGAELTRAAALAGAVANAWTPAGLADHRRRLADVRFSGEWLRPWRAGTLPSPRLDDPVRRLGATGVPVLLLHGRHDLVFPASLAPEAAAELPDARAVVLDEAGHMAHIDQPDRWLAAVAAFLALG